MIKDFSVEILTLCFHAFHQQLGTDLNGKGISALHHFDLFLCVTAEYGDVLTWVITCAPLISYETDVFEIYNAIITNTPPG
jgi:hypothetical protein